MVYVGSDDGNIYALNASAASMSAAQRLIWNYTTGRAVYSSPAVAGGKVFVGSDDGKVYAIGPIHDVAILSVIATLPSMPRGLGFVILVKVINNGNVTETLNVTVYTNTTIIQTFTDVTLNSGTNRTLAFVWDTTPCALGTYTVSAYVTPVPGETNIADNTFVDGTVQIAQAMSEGGSKMPYMD
jgi:hypothetical protein